MLMIESTCLETYLLLAGTTVRKLNFLQYIKSYVIDSLPKTFFTLVIQVIYRFLIHVKSFWNLREYWVLLDIIFRYNLLFVIIVCPSVNAFIFDRSRNILTIGLPSTITSA